MQKSEKIIRIVNECEYKIKEKSSLFHGFAYYINSKEEADKKLNILRQKYYDASHHCYAYKTSNNEEKFSDDGEPNGTAGIRILNSINHFLIVDILVVVVRYFGGRKLGVGPLGKAYAETSLNLLKTADFIELTKYQEIKIIYPFEYTNKIHHYLTKFGAKKISNSFDEKPVINCYLEPFSISGFNSELKNSTNGKVKIITQENKIYLKK